MRALPPTLLPARSPSLNHPRRRWRGGLAVAAAAAVSLSGLFATGAAAQAKTATLPAAGTPAQPAAAAAAPAIVPKPVSMTMGQGQFSLTAHTKIVTSGSAAVKAVGRDLAAYLRPATGYPLPVVAGSHGAGDISVILGHPGTLPAGSEGEGYQLNVTASGVTLESPTAHGLYDGVQTVRQLLPAWIDSTTARPGPWTMPAVAITDYPRYSYRGLMVDIARHFETPAAVEQMISQAAAYKINILHLHVSDDQGFRIVINGFPDLTSIGSQGSVGTDGRTEDPGGFWTQAQYKAVVADAAAHFMTVIPEVDSPGHNNAIIMSEFNDTTNPLLNGDPEDINCSLNNPPMWDFTGDVGYSALCPDSSNSFAIYSAIINQLTAMSPGPYYDLGGDEVPTNVLSQDQYADFINTESGIVTGDGKKVMGWADIAGAGTTPPAGSLAEYWQTASGSQSGTETGTEAVAKGMDVIMAPANHTYLDQKYVVNSTTGNQPPVLGLDWACPVGCDVDAAYNWDPGTYVTGVTDKNVVGVEGAIWGETVVNLSNVDYMVFPRLPALAEVAWSPDVTRTASSPAYSDFLSRLAAQGTRLMAAGVNFYPSTEVPWSLALAPDAVRSARQVNTAVATLAAPGLQPTDVSATVSWGDGSTSAGTVTGTAPTDATNGSLYTVGGSHTYTRAGTYHATVTVSATGKAPVSTQVTITVR